MWKEELKVELQLDHDVLRRYSIHCLHTSTSVITTLTSDRTVNWEYKHRFGSGQNKIKDKHTYLGKKDIVHALRSTSSSIHHSSSSIHTLHPFIHTSLTTCRYLLFAAQLFEKVLKSLHYFLHFVAHMLPLCRPHVALLHFLPSVYTTCTLQPSLLISLSLQL